MRYSRGHLRRIVFVCALAAFPGISSAQYRVWTVGAFAGYGRLSLDAVDEKNQADVSGWSSQGYSLPPLTSVKDAPLYSFCVSYRYDRDFGLALTGSTWSKTVSSSYNGADAVLSLERGVGCTTVGLGVMYFPAARPFFMEWYVQTDLGICFARATAKASGYVMVKNGSLLYPSPFVETDARYSRSKMSAGVTIGGDAPLAAGFLLHADAGYRFAQVGEMDGDVTQMGQHSVQTSSIDFNFSGLLVSAGIRYRF
ncbi:MAG TPA: hypothetical protein VMH23_06915 [Bacteroidota bacterium]|nr:hypothetical protein [Bacteroidota bacterium]